MSESTPTPTITPTITPTPTSSPTATPVPSFNPVVSQITTTSAQVNWDLPAGYVLNSLQLREAGSPGSLINLPTFPGARSHAMSNLQPGASYGLVLNGRYNDGISNPLITDTLEFTTVSASDATATPKRLYRSNADG